MLTTDVCAKIRLRKNAKKIMPNTMCSIRGTRVPLHVVVLEILCELLRSLKLAHTRALINFVKPSILTC